MSKVGSDIEYFPSRTFNSTSLDLREWLQAVKALGELREVVGADRDVDIGPLTQTAEALAGGGPALLFDQIVGFPKGFRILTNANNSIRRFACTSAIKNCHSVGDAIQSWRELSKKFKPTPPIEVQNGPVTENVVEGPNIDLNIFPTPKWHAHDGGRYIGTGDVVITSDPDSGKINLGTYRMMIVSKDRLAGWIANGKHAALHRDKYFERGKPCPVVVSCGHHPLYLLAGASGLRQDLTELDIVGSIAQRSVEVVRGRHTGLPIPANAEIAIEGEFSSQETVEEGPFGEWTGYYASPSRAEPIIKVKALYFRNQPIILGSPPSKPSPSNIQNRIQRSIAIEDHLLSCGLPGIKGVWLHQPGGTRYFLAISIKQNYPGHAKQIAMAALGSKNSNYLGRFVIVVDDDIDVTDLNDVLWAVSTRCDPKDAISIIDGFWTSPLDPAIPWESKKTSSRAVIDACWPYERLPNVPKSCNISPDQKAEMQKKWKLSG
jgi:UbiD family decarboxylase